MLIKAGVSIERLKRPARRGLQKVEDVYKNYKDELTITSTFEGNHSAGSLHYADLAFDHRWPKGVSGSTVINDLGLALGCDFDIVGKSSHIHIEFDPKEI